jgi:magnesium chelatase family protein
LLREYPFRDNVMRVAGTIADLKHQQDIQPQQISEAVGYPSLDRSVWA